MTGSEVLLELYVMGWKYSLILCVIGYSLFTIWRWGKCVSTYIEDGCIDDGEESWFYGDNNWIRPGAVYFGNHPGVVLGDFCLLFFTSIGLSIIWPVFVIVTTVVAYAKLRRAAVVKKETFIAKLDGTHSKT